MRHLLTWFSNGLGSVRFTVGLRDLKGLFQPKWFCDSVTEVNLSFSFQANSLVDFMCRLLMFAAYKMHRIEGKHADTEMVITIASL